MASIQVQAEDKVVEILTRMELPWPPSEEIVARRLPFDDQGDGTAIYHRGITVFPLRKIYGPGTNEREDIGYGVGVLFVTPTDHSTAEMRDRVALPLEFIRRKIVEDVLTLPLVSGATYNQTKVRDLDINLPKSKHRYEVSGLEVRCWVREPRT